MSIKSARFGMIRVRCMHRCTGRCSMVCSVERHGIK